MFIEHIKLSQTAREQLIKLKRLTGIKTWNVLCRWAFCTSLVEQTPPSPTKIPSDSSVEMTWKIFAGEHSELYAALMYERCKKDGFEPTTENLATQFRLHLHRGIGYLSVDKKLKDISGLFARIPLHS